MKRTIILLLFCSIGLNAQPWLDSSCTWHTYKSKTSDLFHFQETMTETVQSDTIINNIQYFKIRKQGVIRSGYDFENPEFIHNIDEYNGAIREEENKWFWVQKDSTEELLLYDFNLEVRDSITIWDAPGMKFPVNLEDAIVLNNRVHKVYDIPFSGFKLIEGVGITNGFSRRITEFWNLESSSILCSFEKQNEIIDINHDSLSSLLGELLGSNDFDLTDFCVGFTSSISDVQKNEFTFYPNPTSDYLNISSTSNIIKLELLDISGRLIQTKILNNKNTILDLLTLENGYYYIRATTSEGFEIQKMLKF